MVVLCDHLASGTKDCTFAGLLVEIDLGTIGIDRTSAAIRVKEEFTLREVVVGATSVVLYGRETYPLGKLVIRAVCQGVLDAAFTYCLPFDLEGALQSLDALLVD